MKSGKAAKFLARVIVEVGGTSGKKTGVIFLENDEQEGKRSYGTFCEVFRQKATEPIIVDMSD